jgi:hypothetical protein
MAHGKFRVRFTVKFGVRFRVFRVKGLGLR